jgi:hypothetical protein
MMNLFVLFTVLVLFVTSRDSGALLPPVVFAQMMMTVIKVAPLGAMWCESP